MTSSIPAAYLRVDGAVAHVVLNRPDKFNAINEDMLNAISAALDEAEQNRSVRALIVRGEGKAFCAGADLNASQGNVGDPTALGTHIALWDTVFGRLANSPLPSIAAVHGLAVAGGFELLLATDFVVLATDAHLADGHTIWGLVPAAGATQRLPRLIGQRRANWLLLSGEPISPAEALSVGLANALAEPVDVLNEATRMAEKLATRSPVSISNIKRAVRRGLDASSLTEGMAIEREILVEHMTSKDVQIGVEAFLTRAVPQFIGE